MSNKTIKLLFVSLVLYWYLVLGFSLERLLLILAFSFGSAHLDYFVVGAGYHVVHVDLGVDNRPIFQHPCRVETRVGYVGFLFCVLDIGRDL